MRITFTLTSGSLSTDAGPFNISGTTNSDVTYWIATGVTKTQLTNGHPVDTIYETITGGTIASTGTCTTTDTWSVTPAPTPTPTSTPIQPTPTAVVSYEYQLGPYYTQSTFACNNFSMDFFTPVYAATSDVGNVVQFFNETTLETGYAGVAQYHVFYRTGGVATLSGQISPSGFITDKALCPG
jgi:hypothetical protein